MFHGEEGFKVCASVFRRWTWVDRRMRYGPRVCRWRGDVAYGLFAQWFRTHGTDEQRVDLHAECKLIAQHLLSSGHDTIREGDDGVDAVLESGRRSPWKTQHASAACQHMAEERGCFRARN